MNVSFQGLNNLYIAKSKQIKKVIGTYPDIKGEIKQGEMAIKEYKIRLDLANDSQGNDYDELLLAMGKAGKGLNINYFKDNPNRIELHTKEVNVLDDDLFNDYKFSIFNINGENINLTSRGGLALYTYIAKLTRELKQNFKLSEEQEAIAKTINQAIQRDAENFINMIM